VRLTTFYSLVGLTLALSFGTASSQTVIPLHDFGGGNDGKDPYGRLIRGSDGYFYGTTATGGAQGKGTVFRIDSAGSITILHGFTGFDGARPSAGLVLARDGYLYGLTGAGGTSTNCPRGCGTFFRISPSGEFDSLASFDNPKHLYYQGLVEGLDHNFYGIDIRGGVYSSGTVFRVSPSGDATVLWSFTGGKDGANPIGSLIVGRDGNLYGTTAGGGSNFTWCPSGCGTIFRINPAGVVTTLHSFATLDGEEPEGELVEGADGCFYGTTVMGGVGFGTVFRFSLHSGITNLYKFYNYDGSQPRFGLLRSQDGSYYGTANGGGISKYWDKPCLMGCGSVFRIGPDGNLTNLWFFNGSGGGKPEATLVDGGDGYIYGTTSEGGEYGGGTFFRLNPHAPHGASP